MRNFTRINLHFVFFFCHNLNQLGPCFYLPISHPKKNNNKETKKKGGGTLSQQSPKCCNRMAKRTHHVAPNNVAFVWPGLSRKSKLPLPCEILTELRYELAAEKQTPISHEQNNSFRLNLASCKHKHPYYGHHSNFRTANFYMKIF